AISPPYAPSTRGQAEVTRRRGAGRAHAATNGGAARRGIVLPVGQTRRPHYDLSDEVAPLAGDGLRAARRGVHDHHQEAGERQPRAALVALLELRGARDLPRAPAPGRAA